MFAGIFIGLLGEVRLCEVGGLGEFLYVPITNCPIYNLFAKRVLM